MKKTILTILLIMPTLLFAGKVINSGHQTNVNFIEYHMSSNSFFSLSDDGTLVIKGDEDDKISRRFFITSNTINNFVLSESDNYFAVVETDTGGQFIISVWDWKKERKLYSINMEEFPMNIGFSGGGNYLYVTSISSIPVKIFKVRTGQATTFLDKNSNFVDFCSIGSSEKYAYLYSSTTGMLDIKALSTSKLLKSIKTEKNLNNLQITPDKRYIVAQRDTSVIVIGRSDGKVYSEVDVPYLESIKLNSFTGEVICYVNNRYRKTIKVLQLISGQFFESSDEDILIKATIDTMSASANNIVYALQNGDIEKFSRWTESTSNFLTNDIINIEGVTLIDDMAVLLTSNKIFLFQSPFFSDKVKNIKRLTSFNIKEMNTPLRNPTGLQAYNGNLLMWNDSLMLYDIENDKEIFNNSFASEIIDIKIKDGKLLALDKNGVVKIIDTENGDELFSFKSPGFTSVTFYNENEIIGGIDSSQGGSLMILDTLTKETRPISTSLDVVFNILDGDDPDTIYITGLQYNSGYNQTYFQEYNIKTGRAKTLLKNNSEELHASYDSDSDDTIFTNMGTKSILSINKNSGRKKSFQLTTNQTSNIVYGNSGIYTINENRSLSIWNPKTGKKWIDFYLFSDNEWVAISQDQLTAFGSPESDRYISSN